jgi:hypothetical protein
MYPKVESQPTCNECSMNRSRHNTLDRFIDEYKNTEAYCERLHKDMGVLGMSGCEGVHKYRLRGCTYSYPMEPCEDCGYYTSLRWVDGEDRYLCRACQEKQYII